jgi:hypothetical protein
MLIWRGWGILVVVVAFVCYHAARLTANHFLGSPLPNTERPVVTLIGMLLAAVFVYALNVAIERSNRPQIVVDKTTGQEIALISKHDLFFIPIKFWPYILGALGVYFLFQR